MHKIPFRPLMIAVQKLTSLAFNLSDGLNALENSENVTDEYVKQLNSHPLSTHQTTSLEENGISNEEDHNGKHQFDDDINEYVHNNGNVNNNKLLGKKSIVANQNSKYFL